MGYQIAKQPKFAEKATVKLMLTKNVKATKTVPPQLTTAKINMVTKPAQNAPTKLACTPTTVTQLELVEQTWSATMTFITDETLKVSASAVAQLHLCPTNAPQKLNTVTAHNSVQNSALKLIQIVILAMSNASTTSVTLDAGLITNAIGSQTLLAMALTVILIKIRQVTVMQLSASTIRIFIPALNAPNLTKHVANVASANKLHAKSQQIAKPLFTATRRITYVQRAQKTPSAKSFPLLVIPQLVTALTSHVPTLPTALRTYA